MSDTTGILQQISAQEKQLALFNSIISQTESELSAAVKSLNDAIAEYKQTLLNGGNPATALSKSTKAQTEIGRLNELLTQQRSARNICENTVKALKSQAQSLGHTFPSHTGSALAKRPPAGAGIALARSASSLSPAVIEKPAPVTQKQWIIPVVCIVVVAVVAFFVFRK